MEKILMVCLGNICRSPMAHGILRHKAQEAGIPVRVDSAGTSGWHAGEQADSRARATMKKMGMDIEDLRSRPFEVTDFDEFDSIYVMDSSNYNNVMNMTRNASDESKVHLILNLIALGENSPVPDPYYGGDQGFENVFELLNKACDHIIDQLNA